MTSDRSRAARFLICTTLFILIKKGTPAQSSTDEGIQISAIAELYYLQIYKNEKTHKAIAAGPGGYWVAAEGRASSKATKKAALAICRAAHGFSREPIIAAPSPFDVNEKSTASR